MLLLVRLSGAPGLRKGRPWLAEHAASMPAYGMVEIERYVKSLGGTDLISLNLGEPDFGTPDHIRESAILAIKEGRTHYTPGDGIQELREAIADKFQRENDLAYSPDQISIVAGSQEGISAITQAVFSEGDEVIMGNPYYPPYFINTVLRGSKPVLVPLLPENDYQMKASDIEKALTPRTKAIIIVNPNNPTGGTQSYEELKAISDIAIENDLLVVSDEIYEKIVYDRRKHYSIGSFPGMLERTITQNGFSKAYAMTGWRIGYLGAPAEICPRLQEIHRVTAICACAISQYAALAALRGSQECVTKMTKEFERRRDVALRILRDIPGLQVVEPKGAFYFFPDLSDYTTNDREIVTELVRETKVLTIPGSYFGPLGKNHIRISFASSIDKLEEGLQRIKNYLTAKGSRKSVASSEILR
jgi:aspartate/methionine/tyrosine aminotransferase